MKILGFQKLTTLDFPDRVAAIIFTYGCNLLCPFCHNPSLVIGNASLDSDSRGDKSTYATSHEQSHATSNANSILNFVPTEEVLEYLSKRRKLLEGLCVSGGEPLLQNDLSDFLAKVKNLGLKIKLDTNGSYPDRLKSLISMGLVDYVAIDIKNSIDYYSRTVGLSAFDASSVLASINYIRKSGIDFELRTTLVEGIHTLDSLEDLGREFGGSGKLYLQNFKRADAIINDYTSALSTLLPYSSQQLNFAQEILKKYFDLVEIRGS